ncbi:VRR-NUC domain-containing protein [Noviherbaspirillum sp. UKPF54]|uniref:VRR-NUC domain-containing protein n=1 Tax=Noviherbaspirillum sp. UKPF54 TaxID=2601898 RepID=UPI0011B10C62|nr:VRR-NUC domain-containing protein [Noviherbaspirillum sp. UKPF54]QDZ27754.1 VRR-NUC domain-containing protein [Noviherbaspirillum sp. UKPF54]
MIRTLENRFYYLDNFHRVLEWITERYSALLTPGEQAFIERFTALPQPSRALLVRMVMRKGELFRASKLRYEEIGCVREAAQALVQLGWIDDRPDLTLEQVFALLTKAEVAQAFRLPQAHARKAELLEALRMEFPEARPFEAWHPGAGECVYQVQVNALCERLKLIFFGNCRQDWSEFVLSDLGIYKYEKVAFSASSLAFRTRADVDACLHLHQCGEHFEQGEQPEDILRELPAALDNDWLERRRQKLLFRIAQHYERNAALPEALAIYSTCRFPEARLRAIRVLERCERFEDAFALADAASHAPESEAESQQLARILPRLRRRLGLPKSAPRAASPVARIELVLPRPDTDFSVEALAGAHLAQPDAPVRYVENTLINSLFGLLCWQAIFAAVPGAFFHPFHTGPADLHSEDFRLRREREFAHCLAQLDSGQYVETINRHFEHKAGIQSPFVFWDILDGELKDMALACIPAAHLKKWFERILQDIPSNRAGLPDLIQFWPAERRYRMIEVKGPGDRLQDNQIRWLDYCNEHAMPVAVCHVQWLEEGA